jgi:glycosyltransferase involved in cell wall biosynthesis
LIRRRKNCAVKPIRSQEKTSARQEAKPAGRKRKILQLCAVDFTIYHFILPLGRELREDFDVHFCSSPGPYVEKIRGEGFTFHEIPFSRSYNVLAHLSSLRAVRKLLRKERFDIVHTHTPIASLIGRFAARLSKVPLVLYTAHGFYFHDRMTPLVRGVFSGLEKAGGSCTDYIFTVSGEDRSSAVALGIISENKIEHTGNGVDLERFNPQRFSGMRGVIRERLDIAPDRPVVCIVGRLVREKGYIELVRAVQKLARVIPDVLVLVVGGALESDHDDASKEIMQEVAERNLDDHFQFLSFRSDVEELLYASDVFTLPSYREGLPVSVMEAMAMELPVVATNIRGSRETVMDGASGILVEVGDIDALAGALASLLGDEAKRKEMGKRGRAIACERFDEKVVVRRQMERIVQLARQKGIIAG